tara:strand:- start:172 stop:423 length:252 start_codon:yes stop_codon:yes gene_type:complete
MYYVDYLAMIASSLNPSLNSVNGASNLSKHKRLSVRKKNQNFINPLFASSFILLLCIVAVPEKQSNIASICEKYNSSFACQVW